MFNTIVSAWKVQDIRNKLIYVFIILAIYRLGSHIPLPGIDLIAMEAQLKGNADMGISLYSLIAGGRAGSIFAMGIGPYITASIIMQLLTVAIPKLEQLKKEGEEGRKKISQYTRIVAVGLAFLQGAGTVYSLQNMFIYHNPLVYLMATVALVSGTIFVMWLGELLTERGVGNGSSFIIFANILGGLPAGITSLYVYASGGDPWNYMVVLLLLGVFLAVVAFVVLVQAGERRIPVQYSKKTGGRQVFGGQSPFIPIKVNIAGVMSIIFAISLLQFPATIHQFFQSSGTLKTIVDILAISHPVGAILYVVLIFAFTFFYTSFAINPIEMAENIKKNGGFIPGIRPGKPTSDYIQKTIDRLSWIGAFFYSIIALVPVLFQWIFNIQMGFGGTTLLIVTGVALDLIKQLDSQLLMRQYKGFLH